MNIEKILNKPSLLIALTSLRREEFDIIYPVFKEKWRKWALPENTIDSHKKDAIRIKFGCVFF